jgi:hypothetical protein
MVRRNINPHPFLANHPLTAGNAIRSAIIDIQPFSGYLSATDLQRSEELLQTKPELLSEAQFKVMKDQIKAGVPQMEFAWVQILIGLFPPFANKFTRTLLLTQTMYLPSHSIGLFWSNHFREARW